jgi:hypothetical protein
LLNDSIWPHSDGRFWPASVGSALQTCRSRARRFWPGSLTVNETQKSGRSYDRFSFIRAARRDTLSDKVRPDSDVSDIPRIRCIGSELNHASLLDRCLLRYVRWRNKNRDAINCAVWFGALWGIPMAVFFFFELNARRPIGVAGAAIILFVSICGGILVGLASWYTFKLLQRK